MLRRSAERTMQAMVAAVFTRLRTLPSDGSISVHTLSSSVSLTDSLPSAPDGQDGVRMSAPDPRSRHVGAKGEESEGHFGSFDAEKDPRAENGTLLDDDALSDGGLG